MNKFLIEKQIFEPIKNFKIYYECSWEPNCEIVDEKKVTVELKGRIHSKKFFIG